MKILVLSDSHAGLQFMRQCVQAVKPDALVHLGDYYEDGQVLVQENPNLRVYQVPGNCDANRVPPETALTRNESVLGVRLYMTHGHLHHVKFGRGKLLRAARKCGVQAVLYGHTHVADCHQEPDGLWVLNPGACGSSGGSAGCITVEEGKIVNCQILRYEDLEEMS